MDVFGQLSVFMLIGFILILIPILYRTKKRPNKANYSTSAVFCLFILGSIVGILGHMGWGMLIILVATLLCIIVVLLTLENTNAEIAEQIKNVDIAEPICFKDFFKGWNFLLKLKRKYGTRKAMVIHCTYIIGLSMIALFLTRYLIENLILINDPWYRGGHWYTGFGVIIGCSVALYFNARRALKIHEKRSTHPRCCGINFCTNCGVSVVPDTVFCTRCGKRLTE
jgi:Ca2+/Na+ antiporter